MSEAHSEPAPFDIPQPPYGSSHVEKAAFLAGLSKEPDTETAQKDAVGMVETTDNLSEQSI